MDNHEKRIGYPKTAYELFLKLYCKKRGSFNHKDRNASLAAVKAWVTLSEEEKKIFTAKYNECKMKHMAIHLEKMEPFMKKKPATRYPEVNFSKTESLDSRCSVHGDTQVTDENIVKDLNTNNTVNLTSPAVLNIQDQQNNTKFEYVEEYEIPVVSEPSPPNVRNAVDLFNIIQNKNEESNSEWSALSKVEKIRYRKAVYQLKKDYIEKYKIYLESLPLKELFKYYHKFKRNL